MLKFLCLVVFVAGALATDSEIDGNLFLRSISTSNERIIGGEEAAIGQFPHQVSLRARGGTAHYCGGSIIAPRFILTAAHCAQGPVSIPANVTVVVGARLITSGGVPYPVDKIINHPYYSQTVLRNDIAVIRTARNIAFTQNIKAIALPTTDLPAAGNVPAFLSGWGQYKVGNVEDPANHPNVLQWKATNTLNLADCRRRLGVQGQLVHANTLCTTNPHGKGACRGDSGGPLTTQGTPRVLIGVVSWGIPCGRGLPDVYSRVHPHLRFIRNAMRA